MSIFLESDQIIQFSFVKYSATGNDFIVIDNRKRLVKSFEPGFWSRLCQRREGIGADGILFLENSTDHSYHMRYLNADGREVAMCGNGARALYHFASGQLQSLLKDGLHTISFSTQKGVYEAQQNKVGEVGIKMTEIGANNLIAIDDLYDSMFSEYLEVGVPHAIFFPKDKIDQLNIKEIAPSIRHDKRFRDGCNVNFVEVISPYHLKMRTFERGVEAETLACGTGATAVALSYMRHHHLSEGEIKIDMPGGRLKVTCAKDNQVWLFGHVKKVYSGVWGERSELKK